MKNQNTAEYPKRRPYWRRRTECSSLRDKKKFGQIEDCVKQHWTATNARAKLAPLNVRIAADRGEAERQTAPGENCEHNAGQTWTFARNILRTSDYPEYYWHDADETR